MHPSEFLGAVASLVGFLAVPRRLCRPVPPLAMPLRFGLTPEQTLPHSPQ
jgi:hypothetical protein